MKIRLEKSVALQVQRIHAINGEYAISYLNAQTGKKLTRKQAVDLLNTILNINFDAVRGNFITFGVD